MRRSPLALAVLVLACSGEETQELPEASSEVIMIRSISERLAVYYPEQDTLVAEVLATGSAPNHGILAGDTLFVINSGFGGPPSLQAVDLAGMTILWEVPMPDGSNPYSGVLVRDTLWITALAEDAVYGVSPGTGEVLVRVPVGKAPEGICQLEGEIYVVATGYDLSNYAFGPGSLWRLEGDTALLVDSLGLNPQGCAAWGGKLYIARTGDYSGQGALLIYDPQNQALDSVSVEGSPTWVVASGEGVLVFGGDMGVWLYDGEGFAWRWEAEGVSWATPGEDGSVWAAAGSGGEVYLYRLDRGAITDAVWVCDNDYITWLCYWEGLIGR